MATNRSKSSRPATTLEGRERQLVAKAVDLAERQIEDGTASSQIMTHFLKMGSSREQLEQKRLIGENELLKARVTELESRARAEELFEEALIAMRSYTGQEEPEYEDFGPYEG